MPEQPLAPQSVLDAATQQAQEEKKQAEESLGTKHSFTLPKFSTDALFDKRHRLKTRVKLLFVGYGVVVFGALIIQSFSLWNEERALQDKYDEREAQYLDVLGSIDLAALSEGQRKLYTAFQEKIDPTYALYAFEILANESNVVLSNPSYSFSSATSGAKGVRINTSIIGTQEEIIIFFQKVYDFKPLISIDSFTATPNQNVDVPRYSAQILVSFAAVPPLDGNAVTLEYKLDEKFEVPFPIRGLNEAVNQIENLRTLPFEGIGETTYGKQNLFRQD